MYKPYNHPKHKTENRFSKQNFSAQCVKTVGLFHAQRTEQRHEPKAPKSLIATPLIATTENDFTGFIPVDKITSFQKNIVFNLSHPLELNSKTAIFMLMLFLLGQASAHQSKIDELPCDISIHGLHAVKQEMLQAVNVLTQFYQWLEQNVLTQDVESKADSLALGTHQENYQDRRLEPALQKRIKIKLIRS